MANGVNKSNGISIRSGNGNGNGLMSVKSNGNGISNGSGFNHNTQLPSPLKSRSFWISFAFYFCLVLLVISILLYAFFLFRSAVQNQTISDLENKIATYGTEEQKASEKQVLDYKKKIDDFAALVDNHKISSNIFSFIESKTMPNTWFLNFDMSESANEIRLTGETESMEALSRQVQTFEESKNYVKSISVLSSQANFANKISFTLSLELDPKVFNYNDAVSSTPISQ